ncbi:N-(5-amino-5-carboxypentanoyl)-L-cysteinyl-D-valine synthase [Talaromyces islandicus]|uniref:ubiquitinyl hydrolase 1 n=1 Tax=Talaromyces islandicus TaxID=28573 RepID=A0A0U1M1A5_TALIS|nr:N-(5-amino-5-carboxypentanoyl)-L-cysteinyl-D-valine synthase [Talaromyces islandicus]
MAAVHQTLSLVFNHLAFPPKLPGRRDTDEEVELLQKDLVSRLISEVGTLKQKTDNEETCAWSSVDASLKICKVLNDTQFINQETLLYHLKYLQPGGDLILNIGSQNACLFIRKCLDTQDIIFEAFETSLTSEQTLASKGALQWDFPGIAVALPVSEFENPVFQKNLAAFIEKASIETVNEFVPKTRKAGVEVSEFRDTVDPAIITQFLMTLLETNGSLAHPTLLRKRTKDDVCWDNAELPWRRSPFWLILRVCSQRILYSHLGAERGRIQYKLLMILVLVKLLEDCFDQLSLEDSNFLKTKICRRFAKLDFELGNSSQAVRDTYAGLTATITRVCQKPIDTATNHFETTWSTFKREIRRHVPRVPSNAQQEDLRLRMPNSLAYLREVLEIEKKRRLSYLQTVEHRIPDPSNRKEVSQEFAALSERYLSLARREILIKADARDTPMEMDACDSRCKEIADEINSYMDAVGTEYESNPEDMGIFVLSLLELWTRMDKCAVVAYPFLANFHPWLQPEILDVLLLTQRHDLERLQKIQLYLHRRCVQAVDKETTIFSDPSPGCVADEYFNSDMGRGIHELQRKIEAASLEARNGRQAQLDKVNRMFLELTERKAATVCTQRKRPDGTHDDRGCEYCYCVRRRYRLKIKVHENFLPSKAIQKRAVVFELGIPQSFDVYREATWRIIDTLCNPPSSPASPPPHKLLQEYGPLSTYDRRRHTGRITLASSTKSYLGTHYRWQKLPAKATQILLPFGMKMAYYDSVRQRWLKDVPRTLSLAHHFALKLPSNLPFSALYASAAFCADGPGPSSYETAASVPQCPPTLTVHEFVASQQLVSGRHRRWLSILTELGAANVNFSLLDTTYLFRRLATQAGPQRPDSALRVAHAFFEDSHFCYRLAEQIDQHVEIIAANWRETNYMETMLILAIQLCALCCHQSSSRAYNLLLKIRRVTRSWVSTLRREMRTAQDGVSEKAARYCFVSALLCRRTFVLESSRNHDLDAVAFQCFVEVTSAMQEALVVDMSKFSTATRNMLTRDIKASFALSSLLRRAVETLPAILGRAIDIVWPNPDGGARIYSAWKLTDFSSGLWATSTVSATEFSVHQVIQYHLLEGHLLINGTPVGKLPADIRDSGILKELFGNQRLISFPSGMPGMSYVLAATKDGNHIHLGYRNDKLVIQAQSSKSIFELVPRNIFVGSTSSFDLPSSLVDNCFHWLDLRYGILEVRRHPRIWSGNTCLVDVNNRTAYRRQDNLIDPHSKLFKLIASIFHHFEEPRMLTVVQPPSQPLRVELRRMDLTFHVNRRNLLQCRQLSAEVDPSQDGGTFYGLQSMIILRSIFNRTQRSIITPLGKVRCQRHGMHVHVTIENDGSHARFGVDNILGRLSSPAEPRLLYHKALLHALTSCFIPDPLTGRTGTEEALSSLQSGIYQPWTPLDKDRFQILRMIANLSPQRKYYPEGRRSQQWVHWHPDLTTTIQHDSLQGAVSAIVLRSQRLENFDAQDTKNDAREPTTVSHLRERAICRRFIYERPGPVFLDPSPGMDTPCIRRDTLSSSSRLSNVREIIGLLRHKPTRLQTTKNLMKLLDGQPVIGGYTAGLSPSSLEERLSGEISHQWGGLVRLCRDSEPKNVYHLMFEVGLLAFGGNVTMDLLRTIVAFSLLDDLKNVNYPRYSSFSEFQINASPMPEILMALMVPCCEDHVRASLIDTNKKKKKNFVTQLFSEEQVAKREQECLEFTESLLHQWPCPQPSGANFNPMYIDVSVALKAIAPEWERLYQNLQLSDHIQDVQSILTRQYKRKNDVGVPEPQKVSEIYGGTTRKYFSIPHLGRDLLRQPMSKITAVATSNGLDQFMARKKAPPLADTKATHFRQRLAEITELETITAPFVNSMCLVESSYGKDLWKSIAALKKVKTPTVQETDLDVEYIAGVKWLNGLIDNALEVVDLTYEQLTASLVIGHPSFTWLQKGNLWPSMAPVSILEQLRSTSSCEFGRNMKEALVAYGLSIVNTQRLIRLKEAFGKGDKAKLHEEYQNRGHLSWSPLNYPDWLLLEIDGNFQIREEQVIVAEEMIHPSSGSNSALQMNMGKGKTSIIIPMIASVLADGVSLSRVLVPKALLSQTAQILQSRLGGLLGRDITHIPFSRRTPTTSQIISEYLDLHNEARLRAGIILGVPEHIMSFKLSGLQRVSDSRITEAAEMVSTQQWLERNCRDVLDECDFTLAVKTQLIYPSGAQLSVDGHPDRWTVIMTVLGLVVHHLVDLARNFPQSIDVMQHTYTEFPVAYFLRDDIATTLLDRLVDSICSGQTTILPMANFKGAERDAIRQFITVETVESTVSDRISVLLSDKPKLGKNVYLLRGLLVHGILLLCLKKRWNVQYGLHPNRDPMAVPFHAKGVPSEQAEWGHPDVAILFTILAFYHQGLSVAQLRQGLQAVLNSDDPSTEYNRWIQTSDTIPEPLRYWNIINVDDEGQILELWRHLRLKMRVINHFLTKFVFPIHAKQFNIKMQSSGWDIPLSGYLTDLSLANGTQTPRLTTGFSGTNDNRRLLPLTIHQRDLPDLLHTNAEVLTYLLQTRNRRYIQTTHANGKRYSEIDLLRRLDGERIRILIDAGAFILEMDNKTLVKEWLEQDSRAQAAVYFGPDNKAWVLYRAGKTVPLIATPFVDNMENCLIYLDEAHTRGTDLKLPPSATGALTLGLNQTKDHTVQAAMRLRQLGTTQSIAFVAPPEVHQSIMDVRQRPLDTPLDSSDVIHWLLVQTCATNRDLQPLYFAQGMDFCRRMQGASKYQLFLTSPKDRAAFINVLQRREHQTLEELYSPLTKTNSDRGISIDKAFAEFKGTLNSFAHKLEESFRLMSLSPGSVQSSSLEEVEQEREVTFEMEEERQLQRPGAMKALKFPGLHPAISNFVDTGVFDTDEQGFNAAVALSAVQLGARYDKRTASLVSNLYVSPEFLKTILRKTGIKHDHYLRPVNWLLWSEKSEQALVIIPEEAEILIPRLRKAQKPDVHLIIYAAPVTKRMLHFNRLDYYSFPRLPKNWSPPPWLPFEIGILAGRLYFDFSEYDRLLNILQCRVGKSTDNSVSKIDDVSVELKNNHNEGLLTFLQEWLAFRRQGQDISHTPMGYMCQGLPLRNDHSFWAFTKIEEQNDKANSQFFAEGQRFTEGEHEGYYDSDDEGGFIDENGDLIDLDEENDTVQASV